MKTNIFLLGILLSLTLVGCTKSGTISSNGSSTVSGSVSVGKVYPSSEGENWTAIQSSSRYYIKGLDITIKGTCTRGIASIKVGEAGVGGAFYSETATCLNDGSFTWSKTYTGPLDTDKTLTLVGYDISDLQMTSSADSVDVHIDNVAPPAVVVTTPASTPYLHTGAAAIFSIVGTCSADTHVITGPYSSSTTPSGVSWTHDVTLIAGSSLDFTYYAYDLAGNQSTGFTQQIQWSPSISLLASGAHPGGEATDTSGALFSLEGFADHNLGTGTDGVSLFILDSGFNYITNSARQ